MTLKCETNYLQNPAEFTEFLRIVIGNNVRSYLEIGSKNGGSLWRVANVMPKGSKVVSIDLPHGDQSFKETLPNLQACIKELQKRGYNATLFVGDSTDPRIIEAARGMGPYDLCFIDANHTEHYVRSDWKNYGSMASIVAFHDIGWIRPLRHDSKKLPIEVPKVWQEISQGKVTREIRHCPRDNGIGIIWMSRQN